MVLKHGDKKGWVNQLSKNAEFKYSWDNCEEKKMLTRISTKSVNCHILAFFEECVQSCCCGRQSDTQSDPDYKQGDTTSNNLIIISI